MAQRRHGPTRAAGVVIIEGETSKQIQDSALGVTGYLGVLEKGPVGELIPCSSLNEFAKRCGGRIAGSELPDACQDFFNHAGGAGELNLIRITDALDEQAEATLWTREGETKTQCMTIKAKNGGRWGGKTQVLAEEAFVAITETTLTAVTGGLALAVNELAGGVLKLDAVESGTGIYNIVSNTAADPVVITVVTGSTMSTDHGAEIDDGWTAEVERTTAKELYVLIEDGELGDDNLLFSLAVYCDGNPVKRWGNLSMDPLSKYYFVNLINDDESNYWITVTDLLGSGDKPTEMRPANWYGIVTGSPTVTSLDVVIHQYSNTVGDSTATVALGTITDAMKYPCKIRILVDATGPPATFHVFVTFPGAGQELQIGTTEAIAVEFANCPLVPPFTITDGSADLTLDDEITIWYYPLGVDNLIGGYLYPDYVNSPLVRFRITDNDNESVTTVGGDLTEYAEAADECMILGPSELVGGYDGDAPTAAKYTDQLQSDNSPFNVLFGQKKGLVKLASPDQVDTTVQKAGIAYADAKNWQWRIEIPSSALTVASALEHINSTIGRNDFAVAAFPSYGYVDDPDKAGQLKLLPLTGAIHGREAAMARNYNGYHKAAAGAGVTLFRILRLADGSSVGQPHTRFDEEFLNPQGIQVIKFLAGNCIIWGDRSVASDPGWRWKHQREMMSHYERTLGESFDFAIFSINDPVIQVQLHSTLTAYFLSEYRKRALQGATFDEACVIKVDNEINTADTRAAGDLHAEIALWLVDTVERLIITMTKDGVFERTA